MKSTNDVFLKHTRLFVSIYCMFTFCYVKLISKAESSCLDTIARLVSTGSEGKIRTFLGIGKCNVRSGY